MQTDPQALTVQFSPHFLRKFAEHFQEALRPDGASQKERGGVLFGAAGPSDFTVQNFREWPLDLANGTERPNADWNRAFANWRLRTTADPEMTWLDLLGWFCLRPAATGELFKPDIDFHNSQFNKSNNLAVIFHSATQQLIRTDIYAALASSSLHAERHRRVSLHVSVPSGLESLVVRPNIQDDMFLKAYEIAGALDRADRRMEWKEKVRSLARFEWLGR